MSGPPSASPLARLLGGPIRSGEVVWIGVRPERRAPPAARGAVTLNAGQGIDGDHYASRASGPRQVTLIQQEDLAAIGSHLGREAVAPGLLRRNIVTRGLNLQALKGRRFWLGAAELEYSGACEPCSRMEEALGPGGYNAMRGRGGITARVLGSGEVRLGDRVTVIGGQPQAD